MFYHTYFHLIKPKNIFYIFYEVKITKFYKKNKNKNYLV